MNTRCEVRSVKCELEAVPRGKCEALNPDLFRYQKLPRVDVQRLSALMAKAGRKPNQLGTTTTCSPLIRPSAIGYCPSAIHPPTPEAHP
jgi:hypothetical protein